MNQQQDNIKVLDTKAQCRDKIAIWFGSRANYNHPIKEIIANATDEIINHFESGTVEILLHDDLKTITVKDSGRGIPIAGETDGVKNHELLFKTLFAGTKYEQTDKTTTGTNGVGLTVINHTSTLFAVESCYNGCKYSLKYENGGELVSGLKKEKCSKEQHGTTITFKLDSEVYPETTYDVDTIKDIVKRFAVSSPKVKLIFKYQNKEQQFHYENLKEYFNELIGKTATAAIAEIPNTLYEDDDEKTQIQLILTTTPEPIQEAYLNLTYLEEGGAFNDGIIAGIRLFTSKHCKDNRLFPKDFNSFSTADIESSISFACVALSNNVEFQNQTKLSTNKQLYKKVAQKHVMKLLEVFKTENEDGFKKMINHLLAVQKHNSITEKSKQALRKKLSEKIDGLSNRVSDLVDSKKHGKEAEIFIAEGQSALGSIVQARDGKFQAAYPLRGKILNCLKADYETIFKNQIITDLIKILGCGIQTDKKNKDLENFDISKLRYGKIIICTDSDTDGFQIACLIITMIYRLMPELLKQGYVYIAQTPLYEIKLENGEMIYFYSETEKDKKLSDIIGKYTISRCKGLGELQPLTMAETAMNPETRNLIKVTIQDTKKMIESLETWMGLDLTNRKQFIAENLANYIDDATI